MKIEMAWAGSEWTLTFTADTEAERQMLTIMGKIENPRARLRLDTLGHMIRPGQSSDLLLLTLSEGPHER